MLTDAEKDLLRCILRLHDCETCLNQGECEDGEHSELKQKLVEKLKL